MQTYELNDIKTVTLEQYFSKVFGLNNKQTSIICDPAKYKIIQGVRQSGKTMMIEIAALIAAISGSYKTIAILSSKHQMSESIRQDIYRLFMQISKNPKGITVNNSRNIHFANGSTIFFGSFNSPDALRGMGIDLLILDEAAYASDERSMKDLWKSNWPVLNLRNSKVIIASTRNSRSKKEFFWKMWLDAVEDKSNFVPFTLGAKDCPHIKNRGNLKKYMSRAQYDREHTLRRK
jgi:phage terminase large subunit